MTKTIAIYDHATGKLTERKMTVAEDAAFEVGTAEAAQKDAEAAQKEIIKASGVAKLAALGLSQDELVALGIAPAETTALLVW